MLSLSPKTAIKPSALLHRHGRGFLDLEQQGEAGG
jgi:hypothetical protein